MSYDIIIFDAKKAPQTEDEFEEWLDEIDDTDEFFDSPKNCTPSLQGFIKEFSDVFPIMGTCENELEDPRETPYGFSEHTIEANFAFSVSEEAGKLMLEIGPKYCVGIYDQQDGEVYFPMSKTKYREGFK